jgi:hypothetical protein
VLRIGPRSGFTLLFALICVSSCAGDGSSKRGSDDNGSTKRGDRDSAAGTVDIGGTSYRPGPMSAVGSVSGVVRLKGDVPGDTAVTASGQPACDVSSEPVANSARDEANTVVWIADPRTGRALPIERRVELTTEHCAIEPRITTAVVGSGLNMFNDDRLLHKLVFTRMGTDDTLAVMPFFNEGQLVASSTLAAKPGVVEIRCAQHGFMHGYILVFDHPYFTTTSSDGSFKIDSLAPGSYKLMVWHEGAAKPVERTIKVTAGGTARTEVALAMDGGR